MRSLNRDNPINDQVGNAFKNAARKPRKRKKYPAPVTLRLSDEERAMLKESVNGMSQSAYIRQCLFGKRASKRVVPESDRVLLAQILARLGETRIANNLNQIAYQANCGSLAIDGATAVEINEAVAHVAWMRVQLIEALGLKDRNKS